MSSKVVVGVVVAALVIVWLADIGGAAALVWPWLVYLTLLLAIPAALVLAGSFLVWLWDASDYARVAMMGCLFAFGLLWLAGMAFNQFDRGPLDCGGPTMAGYVC